MFVLGRLRQKDCEIKPAWAMCLRRAVSKQNNNIKYIFKTWPVFFSLFGILDVLLFVDNEDISFLEVMAWTVPHLSGVTKDH